MTTTAVATTNPEDAGSPKAMVAQYADSFATVLPSHIAKPETWIRIAQGALKKGKLTAVKLADGRTVQVTELEAAAMNAPGVFLATLLDAARLGLEPGTEQYYLTPRRVKKGNQWSTEILGIVGYQGEIDMIYRAGAVDSVHAYAVYSGDTFEFSPATDAVPTHKVTWFDGDRGRLVGVYAFAKMKGGGTSQVIVLGQSDIDRIKKSATGAESEYSPWVQHEESMWLKSAAHRLRKWLPTSAEYRETVRAGKVQAEDVAASMPIGEGDMPTDEYTPPDDDDVVDAEPVCSDCHTTLTESGHCSVCDAR